MSAFIAAGVHQFRVRVYWEDTDAGGVVYYANYLNFAERARTEMLRDFGIEQERLRRETGVGLVVRRATIDYLAPARLDDELTIRTRVLARGGATIDLEQEIRRGEALLARLEIRIAAVGAEGRPVRLPRPIAAAFAPFTRPNLARAIQHAR